LNADRTPPPSDRRVYLGKIVKTRGLRGDLKILPWTWSLDRFQFLEGIWIQLEGGDLKYFAIKRSRTEGGMAYLRLHECPTRELAEPLIGGELFVDVTERDELPESMYFIDDLVGCKVECEIHGNIGIIEEILDQSAQDIWLVKGKHGVVMIPAVKEFVKSVDIKTKLIKVILPDGLVDMNKVPD